MWIYEPFQVLWGNKVLCIRNARKYLIGPYLLQILFTISKLSNLTLVQHKALRSGWLFSQKRCNFWRRYYKCHFWWKINNVTLWWKYFYQRDVVYRNISRNNIFFVQTRIFSTKRDIVYGNIVRNKFFAHKLQSTLDISKLRG